MEPEATIKQRCVACGKEVGVCQCATVRVSIEQALDAIAPPKAAQQGEIEGRYRIIEKIGVGGMGTVYRAEHVVLNRQVAIKVLRNELLFDSQAMARFEQEARACAALTHPNLVAVYDCGITQTGQPYLVMELIAGENLLDIVKHSGVLPLKLFLDTFIEVANGLAYAHSHGVIHRDLKPSNIILNSDPNGRQIPKIVDFGVAKIEDLGGEIQMLTRTGEVFGSPAYMSPEQCEGRSIDQRSDIYALGCVMYEVLSGKQAFKGANIITIMTKQLEEYPPPPTSIEAAKELPRELETLIMRCLQKKPTERPQSMIELKNELENIRERVLGETPVYFLQFKLPHYVVPILVLVAVLACVFNFEKLMPGKSLSAFIGSANTSAPMSKAMLGSYADRISMDEFAKDTYRQLITGATANKIGVAERCGIALNLFDLLFHGWGDDKEGKDDAMKEILKLFGDNVAPLVDIVENSAESDPRLARAASWSVPLLLYYVGAAQEHFNYDYDAEKKYLRGLNLARKLKSPPWVVAKMNQELGDLYMDTEPSKPAKALPYLTEALKLWLSERASMRKARHEDVEDTFWNLHQAYWKLDQNEEAIGILKKQIDYEKAQTDPNNGMIKKIMGSLVEDYRKLKAPDQVDQWEAKIAELEREKLAHKKKDKKLQVSDRDGTSPVVLIEQALRYNDDDMPQLRDEYYEQAMESAEKTNMPVFEKLSIASVAMRLYATNQNWEKSEQLYARIRPLIKAVEEQELKKGKTGFTGAVPSVYYYLALCELKAKRLPQAEDFAKRGLPFCKDQANGVWLSAKLEHILGRVCTLENRLPEAQLLINSSMNKFASVAGRRHFRLGEGYLSLARICDQKKEYKQARQYMGKACEAVLHDNWEDWRVNGRYNPFLDLIERHEKGDFSKLDQLGEE